MEEVKREIAAAADDGWDRRPPDPLIFLVNRMDNMEHRLREEIKAVDRGLRQEMKQEIGSLRQEMKQEIGSLRQEMKQEIGSLRQEMKQEIGSLRQEMDGLRQEMDGLKQEFRSLEKTVFDKLEANQKWMMRLFATMGLGFAGIIITLLIKLPQQ